MHENNSRLGRCAFVDFIRPLVFSLWGHNVFREQMLQEFGLQKDTSLPVDKHVKILNIYLVACCDLWISSKLCQIIPFQIYFLFLTNQMNFFPLPNKFLFSDERL